MDPTQPLESPDPSPAELQKKLEIHTKTCKIITQRIQDTLFELKIFLNGSLDCLLVCQHTDPIEVEAMENLRDLLEERGKQKETEGKEKYVIDQIIIRSRISGVMKTILIDMVSGYREAITTLIENLNGFLQEFNEEYGNLMNVYQKLLNSVAKSNTEKFIKGLPANRLPRLFAKPSRQNPRRLPGRIDPALITPKTLELNFNRYYGTLTNPTPSSPEQNPQQPQ